MRFYFCIRCGLLFTRHRLVLRSHLSWIQELNLQFNFHSATSIKKGKCWICLLYPRGRKYLHFLAVFFLKLFYGLYHCNSSLVYLEKVDVNKSEKHGRQGCLFIFSCRKIAVTWFNDPSDFLNLSSNFLARAMRALWESSPRLPFSLKIVFARTAKGGQSPVSSCEFFKAFHLLTIDSKSRNALLPSFVWLYNSATRSNTHSCDPAICLQTNQ